MDTFGGGPGHRGGGHGGCRGWIGGDHRRDSRARDTSRRGGSHLSCSRLCGSRLRDWCGWCGVVRGGRGCSR
eukprot:558983-Pelagomonas_calceolata.AAC.3